MFSSWASEQLPRQRRALIFTLRPPPEPAPEYQKGGLDGKNTLIKRGALGAPLVSGNVEKRKAIN